MHTRNCPRSEDSRVHKSDSNNIIKHNHIMYFPQGLMGLRPLGLLLPTLLT